MRRNTLHLKISFGKTFFLSLLILLFFFTIGEAFVRTDQFQAPLTAPLMGTRHYQLGPKLARLEAVIKKEGSIDCLVVGSSMVDLGFDPQAFAEGYKNNTGQDIRCFNFGIDASTAASTTALAHILVEDYQPPLLIYGTDARDYAIPRDDTDAAVILESNWIRYRLGRFTLEGWLLEHSALYRYRKHLHRLSRFNYRNTLRSETKLNFEITPSGFTPVSTVGAYINDPPDLQDDSFEVRYYNRILSTYTMLEENLAGLKQMMSLNGPDSQIIIVEMPVPKGLFYFFGNGKEDHQRFVTQISRLTEAHQVPFWQTTALEMIPDDGWVDYGHLNTKGAHLFSSWLGHQVGEAVNQGIVSHIAP